VIIYLLPVYLMWHFDYTGTFADDCRDWLFHESFCGRGLRDVK